VTGGHSESCERTRALISRSLDCELPELQQSLLAAHIRRCAACAVFEADVRSITSALRQAPLEQLGRAVRPPRRRRPARLRVAVQVASFALVAVGVGGVVLSGGPVVAPSGEEALLASPLAEAVVATESIRELRDDALRQGEIAVLPGTSSDPIGEAKPALPPAPG